MKKVTKTTLYTLFSRIFVSKTYYKHNNGLDFLQYGIEQSQVSGVSEASMLQAHLECWHTAIKPLYGLEHELIWSSVHHNLKWAKKKKNEATGQTSYKVKKNSVVVQHHERTHTTSYK